MRNFLTFIFVFSLLACGGAPTESGDTQPIDQQPPPSPVFTRGDALDFLDELYFYVDEAVAAIEAGGNAALHNCHDGGTILATSNSNYNSDTHVGVLFLEIRNCAVDETSANGDLLWHFELFDAQSVEINPAISFEGHECEISMVCGIGVDDQWEFCDTYSITIEE